MRFNQDPELGTRLCRRGRGVSWSVPWLTQQRLGRGGRRSITLGSTFTRRVTYPSLTDWW